MNTFITNFITNSEDREGGGEEGEGGGEEGEGGGEEGEGGGEEGEGGGEEGEGGGEEGEGGGEEGEGGGEEGEGGGEEGEGGGEEGEGGGEEGEGGGEEGEGGGEEGEGGGEEGEGGGEEGEGGGEEGEGGGEEGEGGGEEGEGGGEEGEGGGEEGEGGGEEGEGGGEEGEGGGEEGEGGGEEGEGGGEEGEGGGEEGEGGGEEGEGGGEEGEGGGEEGEATLFKQFDLTFFVISVVQEYERAVIFRLGRLLSGGAKGPGIFFILPCIESYTKVDLRTVSFDVPPQEVISVDAVVYYRVSNPTVSVANVENAHHATRLLAQTTLRNILGTKNMSEILTERETISNAMQNVLDGATDRWGIKVERVEIKDVRLPLQLQRAMAAEAEASREARAKVLAAEGEHQASWSLKEAADTIAQSPAAIQLRYLQTLNSISAEKNSTIIFPLPIDLIKSFMGGEISKKSNSKSSTTIIFNYFKYFGGKITHGVINSLLCKTLMKFSVMIIC
ncbi:hypothetical protein KUTeg_022484 [Tegillarca granosa]|uniref:Band 7 domain-containing protein n=1 Tax=Tegillarca granosa TaxID=220873 RepID=A0ABQ9E735_TEGGR|nr:hypothetical protein KUTeg_022484 [Tegillarca granosa]